MMYLLLIAGWVASLLNLLTKSDLLRWSFGMIAVFCAFAGGVLAIQQAPIVIAKASDHDWEYAEGMQHLKSDTTITRIVVLDGDTLYPTTHYKIIKRK